MKNIGVLTNKEIAQTVLNVFYNRKTTYKVMDEYMSDEKMGSMFIGTVVFFVISALIVCTLIT